METSTLKVLIAILMSCPRESEHHAVTGFWQTWNNPLSQLRLLDALLSLPSDTFSFVTLPGRRIVTVEDVANASPTIKALAQNVQTHTWNSLDLFEVLVRLADSESMEVRDFVREMLDKAVKVSAEIVHVGLLQVQVSTLRLFVLGLLLIQWYRICLGTTSGSNIRNACCLCSLLDTRTTSSYSCGYGRSSRRTSSMHCETFMKKTP